MLQETQKGYINDINCRDIISGNSSLLAFNKYFKIILIDYIDKKTGEIKKRLIGGKWEKLELSKNAMKREAKEELGVEILKISMQGKPIVIIDDAYKNTENKKYHQKDTYVCCASDWRIIPSWYKKSIYKNKYTFYTIRDAWEIIDPSQKELFAEGLRVLFAQNRALKETFWDIANKLRIHNDEERINPNYRV